MFKKTPTYASVPINIGDEVFWAKTIPRPYIAKRIRKVRGDELDKHGNRDSIPY